MDDPELQEVIREHAARLRRLGVELRPERAAAVRNAADGGIAVWIPAGSFRMGSDRQDAWPAEQPAHPVHLSGYYMDRHPVTSAQYDRFVAATGHRRPGGHLAWWRWGWGRRRREASHPVVFVSWHDAELYCTWAGKRLPTEAEWERAARGGLEGRVYPWGDDIDPAWANYGNHAGYTSPVGSSRPNGLGLYDMAGNVWEWCADWFADSYYARSPAADPTGPKAGSAKVLRGGAWHRDATSLRCANRYWNPPRSRVNCIGFRCVQDAEQGDTAAASPGTTA